MSYRNSLLWCKEQSVLIKQPGLVETIIAYLSHWFEVFHALRVQVPLAGASEGSLGPQEGA